MRSAALLQSSVQRTLQQSSLRAVRRACPIAVPQSQLQQAPRAALAAWHCSAASPPRPSTLHVTPRRWISSSSAACSDAASSSSSSSESTASSLVSAAASSVAPSKPTLPPAIAARKALIEDAAQQEQDYLDAQAEAAEQAALAKLKQKVAARAAARPAAAAAAPPAEGAAADAVAPADSSAPAVVDEDAALQAAAEEIQKEELAEFLDEAELLEEELEETLDMLEEAEEDAKANEQQAAEEEDAVAEEEEGAEQEEDEAVEAAEKEDGAVEAEAEDAENDAAVEAEAEEDEDALENQDEDEEDAPRIVADESLLLVKPEAGEEEISIYAEDYVDEDEDLEGEDEEGEHEDEDDIDEEEAEALEEDENEIEVRESRFGRRETETAKALLDMARRPNNDVNDPELVWASMQDYEAITAPEFDEEGNLVDTSEDPLNIGPVVPDLHLQGIDEDTLEVIDEELEEEEMEEEDNVLDAAMQRELTWGMTNKQAAEHLAKLAKREKDEAAASAPKGEKRPELFEMDENGQFTKMADIAAIVEAEGDKFHGALDAEGQAAEDAENADDDAIELRLDDDLDEDIDLFDEGKDGEAPAETKAAEPADDAEEKEEVEPENPLRTGRITDFATMVAEAEKEADQEFAEEEKAEAEAEAAAEAAGEEAEVAAEEGEDAEEDAEEDDGAAVSAEYVPPTEKETLDMLARQARLDADAVAIEFARDFAPGGENYSESKEDSPLGVDETELTPEEAKQMREEIIVARADKQEMLDAIPRVSMTDVEDKILGKRDEDEILAFLTKLKLQDHAEKFHSMQTLLHVKSWELKEMGLTVKQRKMLLRVIDRFKVGRRVKAANDLIRLEGARMEPAHLQAAVYRLMYPHIYSELDWRAANAAKEAEWRARIAKYREERKSKHSVLNGLREPDLMELAKMEATMMRETLQMHKMGYRKQSEIMKKAGLDFEGNPLLDEDGEPVNDEHKHFEGAEEEEAQ